MGAVTEAATKNITSVSGLRLYSLTSVSSGSTLTVPFGTVYNVQITPSSLTSLSGANVYYTKSGNTITFNVDSGTPSLDVMVWGE